MEEPLRVLVAEDHAELAEAIADGLRREGLAVDIALDGAQALERTAVTSYDVIVLDRDLPAVHGDDDRLPGSRKLGDHLRRVSLEDADGLDLPG